MHTGTNSLNVATAGAIILAYRWDHCIAHAAKDRRAKEL